MVLEAKFSNQGADNPGKRQLLCVVRIVNGFLLCYISIAFSNCMILLSCHIYDQDMTVLLVYDTNISVVIVIPLLALVIRVVAIGLP